ncbi:hypothetical protein ACHAPJ_009748 [Fusarium lateritium]
MPQTYSHGSSCSEQLNELFGRMSQLEQVVRHASSSSSVSRTDEGSANDRSTEEGHGATPSSISSPASPPVTTPLASASPAQVRSRPRRYRKRHRSINDDTSSHSGMSSATSHVSSRLSFSLTPSGGDDGNSQAHKESVEGRTAKSSDIDPVASDLNRYFGIQAREFHPDSLIRRKVLRSAVQVARQHAMLDTISKTYDPEVAKRTDLYDSFMVPSVEFMYHVCCGKC